MRLGVCRVKNFCSYKELEFNFSDLSLSLIYGATGSGKSTLQDIPIWTLFGVTAKDGNVDEVKSWTAKNIPTSVSLEVQLPGGKLTVTRVRGTSRENDLYWQEGELETKIRGKDLVDTQNMLEKRLGVTAETYAAATYYNEFSEANNFFLAKAKDRRQLFEKISNQEFAITLAEKITEQKKEINKLLLALNKTLAMYVGRNDQLELSCTQIDARLSKWKNDHANTLATLKAKSKSFNKEKQTNIEDLEAKSYRFESDKAKKIEELVDKLDMLDQRIKDPASFDALIEEHKKHLALNTPICPTCKRAVEQDDKLSDLIKQKEQNQQLKDRFSDLSQKIKEAQSAKNPYKDLIIQAKKQTNFYQDQIVIEENKQNPFEDQLKEALNALKGTKDSIKKHEEEIEKLNSDYASLELLYDLSFVLRGQLLKETVIDIQNKVNNYLTNYFESEFQVIFELNKSDSLLTHISKNGNACVYTQLSKGQRQLLKLCFTVAIMQASANNAGVKFNALFFDEPCDGLDETLKLKAFRLFEELALDHSTILVTDHTQSFQNMFENKYLVELIGDESVINHA